MPLLTLGGRVVILPRWDPDEMLRLIGAERVTMLFCVPQQYAVLLAAPGFAGADLSSVRFLTSGGAPLPVELIERWRAVHDTPFKQGFGMTEFGPGVFSMGPEHAPAKAGSIGRPNTFVEAAVVDPGGPAAAGSAAVPLPPGKVGELVLRGPAAFSGYFVEAVLRRHPAVADCAVVGVPDPRWGEVGRAYVVLREGLSVEAETLRAFAKAHLAAYKVPKELHFADALPYSAAGKVLKRDLRSGG